MFIIAHFHTQPARNNHLGVCVRDSERESRRDTGGNMGRQLEER